MPTSEHEERILLHISPGPVFNPRSVGYQLEWEELSRRYRGHILTTSVRSESIRIGRFTYSSMRSRNRLLDSIRFMAFCTWRAVALRLRGERVSLVTTYDPLKTGSIGVLVAAIHGAHFVPRVNGVYTSEAEWLDQPNSLQNRVKKRLYPAIMSLVIRRADGIKLLFSDQLAPFEHLLRGKVVRVFPSRVSTDAFKDLGEEPEVLFVGFPFKRKGVDVLIRAFKQVAPNYPDWSLKILGWYPDPSELQAAIAGHPQIRYHLPVSHSEMPQHIGRCAILALPSRSEAMGRVLVEAMAAAKPRIGSRIDGIPTVINDGVDGYLVEPGNVDDLAEKLDALMADPALRRSMGLAGKARIATEFSEALYVARLTAFYDEVLGS